MSFSIRRVDYFYTTVHDRPGQAYDILSQLADMQVNLLAFNSVPMGAADTRLALFPEDSSRLTSASDRAGIKLEGPHPALLVQGDDTLGALANVHKKLAAANVNVYASSCVASGAGSYGYLVYVRAEDYDRASDALEI